VVNCIIDAGIFVCFNTMLSAEEASQKVLRRNRILAPSDVLDQGVIVFIEPVEEEAGKFRVTKRLPNRGQRIGKRLHFVVEGLGGEVALFDLAKMVT
jgi:hypothetical protein